MDAWADGLNFYLATHPRGEAPGASPGSSRGWRCSFTEGSIGGDIERISLERAGGVLRQARHCRPRRGGPSSLKPWIANRTGSNGFAIAPSNTSDGHALLLINPHTSFFFRSELQMTSDAGLNAYGAATWGQFFIYQGFNAHAGWMHTSSTVDVVDEFAETIVSQGRQAGLPVRGRGRDRWTHRDRRDRLQDRRRRVGEEELHHLPHPSRPDRPRRRRQVGGLRHDVQAGGSAGAVVPAHQGCRLRQLPEGGRAEGQFLEQHPVRRRQGRGRPICTRSSSPGATTASTTPSRSTGPTRPPTGRACTGCPRRRI